MALTTTIQQEDTSLQVFRKFIHKNFNSKADASQVLSKQCYRRWLDTRRTIPEKPEESFRRVLTAHVRGTGGRKPFHRDEEQALLTELRKKRVWPCFEDNPKTRVGIQGFKLKGYHEAKDAELGQKISGNESLDNRRSNCLSSFEVFLNYAALDRNGRSRILSKDCYHAWLSTRRHKLKNPQQAFRKTLIAHLCGRDGRRSFPVEIHSIISNEVKCTRNWPCFEKSRRPSFTHSVGSHDTCATESTLSHEEILDIYDSFSKDVPSSANSCRNEIEKVIKLESDLQVSHKRPYETSDNMAQVEFINVDQFAQNNNTTFDQPNKRTRFTLPERNTAELLTIPTGVETTFPTYTMLENESNPFHRIESMSIALDEYSCLVDLNDASRTDKNRVSNGVSDPWALHRY